MFRITEINLWHVIENVISLGAGILFTITLSLICLGCPSDQDTEWVCIDDTYWEAYRNPDTFDDYLSTADLDSRTLDCFFRQRDAALDNEQAKLVECSAILQDSPLLGQCHEEADRLHDQALIMGDIANAIDGSTRYDETQSYYWLIYLKFRQISEEGWDIIVDLAKEQATDICCDYST